MQRGRKNNIANTLCPLPRFFKDTETSGLVVNPAPALLHCLPGAIQGVDVESLYQLRCIHSTITLQADERGCVVTVGLLTVTDELPPAVHTQHLHGAQGLSALKK